MICNASLMLRVFDVSIGTRDGKDTHRVVAQNAMAAYRWALQKQGHTNHQPGLCSLVIKPAHI